jgi:phosphomethylpyrimidine synthase
MNAIDRVEKLPTSKSITRKPFANSKKVYVPGKLHDIQVAMREVSVNDAAIKGPGNKGSVVTMYDTSGPYSDPDMELDVRKGLPRLREKWIMDRGDVEQLTDLSSQFGKDRLYNSDLDHLRFQKVKKPLRAKAGKNVSQLCQTEN